MPGLRQKSPLAALFREHCQFGQLLKRKCQRREISMRFRPLHDRVVIRRIEQEEKTAGGIIIPDTAKAKPQEGEIIAVGPGARGEDGTLHPLDVKTGDRVLFGKWSGTEEIGREQGCTPVTNA